MAVNNPHGHNQYTGHKKTSSVDVDSKRSTAGSSGSARGGTSEQHAEASRQSHKNDEKSSNSSAQGGGKESSSQGGRQNHKNDG